VDEVQPDEELRLAIRQAPHFVRVPDFSEEGGGHWRTGDRSTTFGDPMVDDRWSTIDARWPLVAADDRDMELELPNLRSMTSPSIGYR
jgi:hypothetical protein